MIRILLSLTAASLLSAADWTADGYNIRPDMGVPSSWLKQAAAGTLSAGTVVMDQSGKSPDRYVMVAGVPLRIGAAEWTADGYNTRALLGVPTDWLAAKAAGTLPNLRGHLAGWILNPQSIKPGTFMPPTPLASDELQALLAYLESLR